jgi:hypothetical protein
MNWPHTEKTGRQMEWAGQRSACWTKRRQGRSRKAKKQNGTLEGIMQQGIKGNSEKNTEERNIMKW